MNTSHLSPDELVAVLDGEPGSAARAHLEHCVACRAQVDALQQTLLTVSRAEVPEPSPLFWDHLSARIGTATAHEAMSRGRASWMAGWRPLFAAGALAAAALLVVIWMQPASGTRGTGPAARDEALAAQAAAPHEAPWETMSAIAANLSPDDVQLVVAAAPEFAPTVGELTASEREAFVALLDAEFGGDAQ